MIVKNFLKQKPILIGGTLGIIFTAVLYFWPSLKPPRVVTTSPELSQVNVLLDSPVVLNFAEPIKQSLQKKLVVDSSPVIVGTPSWSDDGKSLRLTPLTPLVKNTTYYLDLIFQNKVVYSFSFTTNPFDAEDLRIQAQNQATDDKIFSASWEKIITDYSWYPSLPVDTPAYYIFFDFDTKIFDIHLKNKPISSESQTQIESAALDSLKKIGVPDNLLEYNVIID